jgi:hypothetical protein
MKLNIHNAVGYIKKEKRNRVAGPLQIIQEDKEDT